MLRLDREQVDNTVFWMMEAAQLEPRTHEPSTYKDQVVAFTLALRIFGERNVTRGDGWRSAGLLMMANYARGKAERVQTAAERLTKADAAQRPALYQEAEDSALDLINYGAFCARLVHEMQGM